MHSWLEWEIKLADFPDVHARHYHDPTHHHHAICLLQYINKSYEACKVRCGWSKVILTQWSAWIFILWCRANQTSELSIQENHMPHIDNINQQHIFETRFLEPISTADSTFLSTKQMELNSSKCSLMMSDTNSCEVRRSFTLRRNSLRHPEFLTRSCTRSKQAQIKKVGWFLIDDMNIMLPGCSDADYGRNCFYCLLDPNTHIWGSTILRHHWYSTFWMSEVCQDISLPSVLHE